MAAQQISIELHIFEFDFTNSFTQSMLLVSSRKCLNFSNLPTVISNFVTPKGHCSPFLVDAYISPIENQSLTLPLAKRSYPTSLIAYMMWQVCSERMCETAAVTSLVRAFTRYEWSIFAGSQNRERARFENGALSLVFETLSSLALSSEF